MILLKMIILFVYLTSAVDGENTNISCPRFCKCDSYLLLNRAQCSSRKLISAEMDLSNQVQILDLSYNDISAVDTKCFENFRHIKHLNLSNNALHTIDWNAFYKLRQLTEIDLSYNRLEYLDERLFAKNKYLYKINLEGNKLGSLQNKPLLNNSFVSELSLRNSQINFLQPHFFAGLTGLKRLDLSDNLLNHFNIDDFKYLQKLRELNLNKNFVKCDDIIKSKLKQMEQRGITVAMDNCLREINVKNKPNEKMFEKLIMTTQQTGTGDHHLSNKISQWRLNLDVEETSLEDSYEDEFDSKKILGSLRKTNEWLRFAPDAILCNKPKFILCQEYRSCLQDLNEAWQEKRIFKEQYPLNDIKFAFIMGMSIGVSAVVFIVACTLCGKRCMEIKRSSLSTDPIDDSPAQPLAPSTTHLPPQVRRQSRRRTGQPPRSMVRYEGPVAENFLSRLFGRPARSQYYRTINQNTATLIRRLSQSNLFNNRLSQHFIDRPSNAEVNSPEVQDSISPDPSSSSALRRETPPPSYGDIVKKV